MNLIAGFSLICKCGSFSLEKYIWNDSKNAGGYSFFEQKENHTVFFLVGNAIKESDFKKFVELYVSGEKGEKCMHQFLFDGSYSLIVIDKENGKCLVQNDYLGLNTLFFRKNIDGYTIYSSLGLAHCEHKLSVNSKALIPHFGFGYHVEPHPFIYEDIIPIKGNALYEFDKFSTMAVKRYSPVEKGACASWSDEIPLLVKKSVYQCSRSFCSLTSGKDSLTIIAALGNKIKETRTGTFGDDRSADVMQSVQIAKCLQPLTWEHVCLTSADEFSYFSNYISFFSGGLATLSYVDMMKYVHTVIPAGYSFIMGEGGECTRDFFHGEESDHPFETMDSYITPYNALMKTLNEDLIGEISSCEKYKEKVISSCLDYYEYLENNKDAFYLRFYRYARMAGNFSMRHQILNPLVPIESPFLSCDFIKTAYDLNPKYYNKSSLHRKIIEACNPLLLPYFDSPVMSSVPVQNWNERFVNGILLQMINMYKGAFASSSTLKDFFSESAVLQLLYEQRDSQDRAIWFLLRLLSFGIFEESCEFIYPKLRKEIIML